MDFLVNGLNIYLGSLTCLFNTAAKSYANQDEIVNPD